MVLEFYHTMTSRGVSNPMQLRFSIDGLPGILRASDITTALGLPVVLENSTNYRKWPHPSPREMIRSLSLEILQPDLYFSADNFLRRFSSRTTYFGPICSHCSIIYSVEELFSRLCTEYSRGIGLIRQSLS